ncbi:Na(+)-translocating NADH-quinone reductase subunit A [uncultured Mesonia sp.]|uniref:Na(+)-translocating NADH-quinone reductase subunit A n=1 Tax=uncultured Mesonia sp. TaxID=399731 RepID=UPI00374EDA6B
MSKGIKVKKGLDLRLVGEASKELVSTRESKTYVIKPSDFHLVVPKMIVKEGGRLKKGDPIFYAKGNEDLKVLSPVSGTLTKIERGAKRVILRIFIEADAQQEETVYNPVNISSAKPEEIKKAWLQGGCWPFIMQRPYDVIANQGTTPRDIFISGFSTAPLAADVDFVLQGKEKEVQVALSALSKLTSGKVHVGVNSTSGLFATMKDIELHQVSGPHPAGNVGTQINKLSPVNKGETVWTIAPQHLAIMGEMLLTGKYNPERIIAFVGSSLENPKYFKTKIGAELDPIIQEIGLKGDNVRVINGDVLTGVQTEKQGGHLGFANSVVTVIPEGDDYEFFGWNKPVFDKISTSRALTFSWLNPKKKYELTTNTNGEHRAFVLTGNYEEVFPLDIYPLQTLKACMVKDLDQMEALGMYEVAPEDFALTEFICVSKQPHQQIIREGLDLMYKEIG